MGKHAGTKRIRILQPLRLVNNYHVEISLEEAADVDIWNFLNRGPKWAPVDGSIAAISAAVGDSEYLFYEAPDHRSVTAVATGGVFESQYLRRVFCTMSDDTGILQHAIFSVPNTSEGYTTDDNARALIVSILLDENPKNSDRREYSHLSHRYLSFLWLAFHADSGRFRNFLDYDRKWLENFGSDDSHGRALWSLGTILGISQNAGLRGAAGRLFEAAVPAILTFSSPRAWAYSILGLQAYLDWFPGDRAIQEVRNELANRLFDIYERSCSAKWRWFEKSLSYSNARLSQALILAGWRSDNHRMIEAGMDSLKWLVAEQHRDDKNIFVPIGSNGFFVEGSEKARFDQQPVEACATVSACLEVYRLTEESLWLDEAQKAFKWFLGKNDLQVPLYDAVTGGCRDGLHPDRVNENQGAESTLSFLMALLEMQSAKVTSVDELHHGMRISL